jgi:hypothetical protein
VWIGIGCDLEPRSGATSGDAATASLGIRLTNVWQEVAIIGVF